MGAIIGRDKEVDELKQLVQSQRAEFVAIYGRRRVGKTFLVDEALREDITFRHAGLSPVDENGKANKTKEQLLHFYHSLLLQGWKGRSRPKNWLEAFFFFLVCAFNFLSLCRFLRFCCCLFFSFFNDYGCI